MLRLTLLAFALAGLTLAAPGCDSLSGCDKDVQILEAAYDELGYDLYRNTLVPQWESRGYNCVDEPLRNAFGTRIGTRWTCTGCA